MKKRDLVPGVKYAVVTRAADKGNTRRKGIPDVDTYTYFGDSHPGLKTRKDQVIVYRRWGGGKEVKLLLVRPSDIWSTEDKYDEITSAYDEEETRRAEANVAAARYLRDQMDFLYHYRDVSFDAEGGVFHVSPKVMAELHNLPVPGKIETPEKAIVEAPTEETKNVA